MSKTQFQYDSRTEKRERALLVTVKDSPGSQTMAEFSQQELISLTETMGMEVAESVIVPIKAPRSTYLIGTGKVKELCEMSEELEVDCIIFDQDLNPSQQRNWEKISEICVIDRREVILQIFADRASTKEAVLQVALARQEYSLPRLTRAWTHLSRQRGGSKGTRGEGETQLEVDRRLVMKHISQIKKDLKGVRAHRETQRKQRQALPVPTGSIVGYTNAGKSSLLKALTDADVLIEDKLFATLDPTTRKIRLPGGAEILLTDTVGFVQNLPHDLVDAFRSTLEETKYSDFIIHLIDASHPEPATCYQTTLDVLESLGCTDKPAVIVINKVDLCDDMIPLAAIRRKDYPIVSISAKTGEGIDKLLETIEQIVFDIYPVETYHLPQDRYDVLAFMRKNGSVITEDFQDDQIVVSIRMPDRFKSAIRPFLVQ
ncbi:MAG: GTPase HflX [Spirochaetia bacterium]|nr:GTPase HflX [Spirochaetia bacterium]MCF7941914.1 GTPase HflX [Spirochaetia bacterium]